MEGIAPNLEELQSILNHQLSLYRQLVDLLRLEKEHVIAVRLKDIRECTYSKEAILDEIQREEFRRQRWAKEAAAMLGVPEKEITLEIVADRIGRDKWESLFSLKQTLVHLIKKSKEMNAETQALVTSALKDTQEMKQTVLGFTAEQPQTYGPKGNMNTLQRDRSARLLSKEA